MAAEYEYILVGCGVAAATVAKTLLEHNRSASILMLEAGPEVEARNRRHWWDYVVLDRKPYAYTYDQPGEYQSIGNINWDFRENRVLAFGGSTMHWGGWSLRFKPEDFELYSRTGEGADWLFGYNDLEPYYCRAEEYLSVCGAAEEDWGTPSVPMTRSKPFPLPPFWWTAADSEMIKGFEENGIKPGKMPVARYRKCLTTGTCKYCPFGSRFNAQSILDDLWHDARHTGLKIQCHAPAVKVLADTKRHIKGVRYLDTRSGDIKEVLGGTTIICAGAYESPKLLMMSWDWRHWRHGIGNDYDLLGRHIISHSMLKVRGQNRRNDEQWFQELDFPTLMSRTYDTPEYQKDGKIFLFKNRALPNVDLAALMIQGKPRHEIEEIVRGPRQQELQAFMEEKGRFHNRLTMTSGTNRFGLPRMKIDFNRTEKDRQDGQNRLKLMEKVITSMGYTIVKSTVDDPGGHHTTGTCRMGATPKEGVTDADLKVHETDNLYICSNAVFPTGSAVNPTLTLTALAFRLGDHLCGATTSRPVKQKES